MVHQEFDLGVEKQAFTREDAGSFIRASPGLSAHVHAWTGEEERHLDLLAERGGRRDRAFEEALTASGGKLHRTIVVEKLRSTREGFTGGQPPFLHFQSHT